MRCSVRREQPAAFWGATVSGFLYAVEPGVPLLTMGLLYLLVTVALLVVPSIRHVFSAVSVGHGRVGQSESGAP
jgi:hypothetical protein